MRMLRTEIEIDATPESVWKILADFDRFPEWNPFIREIEGEMKVGSRLRVFMKPSGGRGMTFRPVVKQVERNREFRWLGHLFLPGLFDGEHIFELLPAGAGKTRFIQRESFRGLLVPLLLKSLEKSTRQGFIEMNTALKVFVEEIQ